MKKHLVTVAVVIGMLAVLVLINRYQAERVTEERQEAQQDAEAETSQAKDMIAEMRQTMTGDNADEDDETPAEDPVENTVSRTAPDESPALAPDTFTVKLTTTTGDVVLRVHPDWAPLGAARFREMVEKGLLDDAAFFRVVPGFIVQFGIPGDPKLATEWHDATIPDDPVRKNNARGTVTFAKRGSNSRTTQLFINYGDNSASLDNQGFAPFAEVIEGMEHVDAINSEYGEAPNQMKIRMQGNSYLKQNFPNLDYVEHAELLD